MSVATKEQKNFRENTSNSFLRLRRKIQNQMKKKNISYDDILRRTEEAKNDKQNSDRY